MSDYQIHDKLLLAGVETTKGTAESLTPGSNAIKCRDLQFSPQFEADDGSGQHTSSLDPGEPTVLGGGIGASFAVDMKGPGTAGQAPEWGPLLRGCGMLETLTASAVSDTAQAGAASAITLHAGASATDDFYKGMVIETTGGTGPGQSNVISAYNGTTKVATVIEAWAVEPDNTTTFDIVANALYSMASTDLKAVTLFGYQNANASGTNSLLRKLAGGMGSMSLELGPRAIPRMNFTYQGLLPALPTNVARPTGVVFDAGQAPAFRSAKALLAGSAFTFQRATLDQGGQLARPDNPAATFGLDAAAITSRRVTGTITPYLKLLSQQNFLADFTNATEGALSFRWGTTAGNRMSILVPRVRYTPNPEETAIDNFAGETVPFAGVGADNGLWICVH